MPDYRTSINVMSLLLTVISWQCQLLPGTISGANSHAGAEEGRARAIPPKSPKFKTGSLIVFACSSALGPSSSQTLSLAPQLQVVPKDPVLGTAAVQRGWHRTDSGPCPIWQLHSSGTLVTALPRAGMAVLRASTGVS